MSLGRWLAWGGLLAASAVASVGCGENVVRVEVVLADAQRGFACVDDAGEPLLARVAASGNACAVADFVRWEGTPSCRVAQLRDACCGGGCATLRTRQQIPIDVPTILARCGKPEGGLDPACAHDELSLQLRSFAWSDVPSGFVSLRVVVTDQACTASEEPASRAEETEEYAAFDRASLVACVFSCPAELAALESPLELDLDVLDERCEPEVVACASLLGSVCAP